MRTNHHLLPLCCILSALCPITLSAQVLTSMRHTPQPSDSLLAYKLPYLHVNDTGRNCMWDFSQITTDKAEVIEVDYFASSADTTRVGLHREHANYYYRHTQDTLWLIGYENSRTHVRYSSPLPLLRFPLAYGDSIEGAFSGKGQYCHLLPFSVEGTITSHVDAMGKLVLPEMTIDTAIRVCTKKHYEENMRAQTIVNEKSLRWYSPYCRYPLLETVCVQTIKGNDTTSFASSYYFPQEQDEKPSPKEKQLDSINEPQDSLITNVVYAPNPVYTDLTIQYSLVRSAQVCISIHYNGGASTYQTPVRQEEEGPHSVTINMSALPVGTYVVYIHADDSVVSGSLIKL